MSIDSPQDEVSVSYNLFEGGGITVHGPAVIIQKALKGKLAIEAGGRVDLISSASIDVVTQASKFSEERQEYNIGVSNIFDGTRLSTNYSYSDESDYTSNTLSLGMTHDLFDKNFTIDLTVSRAWDEVGKNSDPSFGLQDLNRTNYSIGLTQSLTPRWLAQFNYEVTAEDGFINNPYRNARTTTLAWVPENYPETRTGQAWVVRSSYGFPSGGTDGRGGVSKTIQLTYRYYRDTFDIQSHTGKTLYQQSLSSNWMAIGFYRYYRQDAASFYGDLIPLNQTFKARDKELSTFSDHWIGLSIQYEPMRIKWGWIQNPYLKAGYSYILYKYDNFSDPRNGEPYSWNANVFQASFGFNY